MALLQEITCDLRHPMSLCHPVVWCVWRHTAQHCNMLQHVARHCNALQHTPSTCPCLRLFSIVWWIWVHTGTHCTTPQHAATCYNELQQAATLCNTLQRTPVSHFTSPMGRSCGSVGLEWKSGVCMLQCAAVCCSVLQCVSVCCRVLQRVAMCCTAFHQNVGGR